MIHLCFILKQSKGKLVTVHLDNRWRWVISFTPRPLHLREREASTDRTGRWRAAQPDKRVRVWRRETSLPGMELEFLGHPASSLFTIPSRVLMFLLVNLSRIQDYVWFWYFPLKKPLSDEKLFSTLPVTLVEQQKVCRYTVTDRQTALVSPVVLSWKN